MLVDVMNAHLIEEERQMGNCRNGKIQKQVQTPLGEITVSTSSDRNSHFVTSSSRSVILFWQKVLQTV